MAVLRIFLWLFLISFIIVPAILIPILVVTSKKRAEHVAKKTVIVPKLCRQCGNPVPPGSPICVICGTSVSK